MLRIAALPYTLQFRRPAITSRGALRTRQVVFLRAEMDGVVGWGECGPVPGLSPDDRPDFLEAVQEICGQVSCAPGEVDVAGLPSVAFGLETALRDLDRGGRQQLFDSAFTRGQAAVPVHGLIWMNGPDEMLAQIETKVAAGCGVIKMKVGGLPFDQELGLLAELRRRYPDTAVELRLDANGCWKTVHEALDRLEQLARFRPAFLEQPLPAGRWQETAILCARSPVPVALDEELIGAPDPRRLMEAIGPQHVILKPSLLGGIAACETWIAEADRLGITWWINSLLESNVGLNAIAQWTSSLADSRVHGLGTGQLFVNNIPSPLQLDGCGLRMDGNATWNLSVLQDDSL